MDVCVTRNVLSGSFVLKRSQLKHSLFYNCPSVNPTPGENKCQAKGTEFFFVVEDVGVILITRDRCELFVSAKRNVRNLRRVFVDPLL